MNRIDNGLILQGVPSDNPAVGQPGPGAPRTGSFGGRSVSVVPSQPQLVEVRSQVGVAGSGRPLNERQIRAVNPRGNGGGVLAEFGALADDLARPGFSDYLLEDRVRRLLDGLPGDPAEAGRIFQQLGRAVEARARRDGGRQELGRIVSNQKFGQLHQALKSCIPALSKLRGEGRAFERSLEQAKMLVKLMDGMVSRSGGRSPKALGVADVTYQMRTAMTAVLPGLGGAVKTRLAQPAFRALGHIGNRSDLPNGPRGVPDTRRVLMKCLDGYRAHEQTFDPLDQHGRTHATRAFVFANVMGNILREFGVEVDVDAVAMMAAGHDIGREHNQRDVFEDKSSSRTGRIIKETFGADPNAGNDYVDSVTKSITTSSGSAMTVEAYLLHCADSLDFWRVDDLEMERFPFLREDIVVTGRDGNPLKVQMMPRLREALARESRELTKLTNEIAAMDMEMRQIRDKEVRTEEDIQRHQELALKQQEDSDWMRDVWQPRMERSNEEVVSSIEQAIRGNPDKFPLLSRFYLGRTGMADALGVLRRGLVTDSGIANSNDVKAGIEGLRAHLETIVKAKRGEAVAQNADDVEVAALNAGEAELAKQLKEYAANLSNGELTVMYESLQGKEVSALRQRMERAGDAEGPGLLDDLEAAIVYEIAQRVETSVDAPERLDQGRMGSMTVESMATLVETTSQAVMKSGEARENYSQKIGRTVSNPVSATVIGDILRNRELTINFKPIYLFGDLKDDAQQPYPVDTGDHKYKNLFHVQEMTPDRYIPDFRLRQDVENLRFPKIGISNLSGKSRPTYTALNGAGRRGGASEYGNSVIVLKPKCKKRATYAYGGIDYMMPVAIKPENEERFIVQLKSRAIQLCMRERIEKEYRNSAEQLAIARKRFADNMTALDFIAALDDPTSDARKAIRTFFAKPEHATDEAYRRLENYETDSFARNDNGNIEDWDTMVDALNLGIQSSDGELVACLFRSCTPPEGQVEKETDFEHIENLLQDMRDYDDVRMNLSIRRNKGEKFALDGAGFIEAKLHQELDIYEDVEEIRFSWRDLPEEGTPLYERRVGELREWGRQHGVRITILTAEEDRNLVAERNAYEREVNDFVNQNVRNQHQLVRIDP